MRMRLHISPGNHREGDESDGKDEIEATSNAQVFDDTGGDGRKSRRDDLSIRAEPHEPRVAGRGATDQDDEPIGA